MTVNEIRDAYLNYFKERGHIIIPSSSIVPLNDPTTLFTGSGMQPLVPYLLGEVHPLGNRLVDSQKCFRAEDIEEIGDNRHTTFFEMLGNWSLGEYFKAEQLPWFFGFLTDVVGLNPNNLYVTAFQGDESNNVPRDTEAAGIWQTLFTDKGIDAQIVDIGSETNGYRVGMQGGRIFYYEAKKNWWSRAGVPEKMPVGEIGGPDSEVFYDFGLEHDPKWGEHCHPNCDCGRFVEIGNSVFMQYIKKPDGTFGLLPKQNVDFGGGLERIAMAANNNPDIFLLDVFKDVIDLLEKYSNKSYTDIDLQKSFRIIADHMRGVVFMLAAGITPSNTERGYILRRLLRRAAQHALKLGLPGDQREESILNRCAIIIIEKFKHAYLELASEQVYETITSEIWKEEKQFGNALDSGMKEFERIVNGAQSITGEDAFTLFTTYGFPFEMTQEIATERGIAIDVDSFKEHMKKHQDLSRAGSEHKFKGGLADTSEQTTRLHTTHHLLLKALQRVLGEHVHQRGSNITQERLRIDFSHTSKMTPEQIVEVERIVNEQIAVDLPVVRSTLPRDEAEKLGAEHEFGAKYPDMVSVYSIGPVGATLESPHFDQSYSIEFCGGPHVERTGMIAAGSRDPERESKDKSIPQVFKIQKEEAVASGIRRIKGVIV